MGELIEYGKYASSASCSSHCELQVDMRVANNCILKSYEVHILYKCSLGQ